MRRRCRKVIDKDSLSVAMIGHKAVPGRAGGVEVVVEELSVRMAARGHRVTCYNRREDRHACGAASDAKELSEYKGVRLKDVWTLDKRGLAALTASISASVDAAFGDYDIVHFHAEGPSFMCWLPKLFGKKVVVTVHGLDHKRAKWGPLASAYIMMGERSAVRFADEIIVLSRSVQQYFRDTYGRKTRFIPNGVDQPVIKDDHEIAARYGLEKDGYILFLGRLVPEKGLEYLIEAYRGLRTDKKLVIAGGSSDTDAFIKKLKKQAADDDRVIFTGFVQGEILEELYSNAYIYTLPSDLEGMPLSLLEAMSYGNCCVVSDIAECTEVITDKAVTFRKGSTEDLQKKLQMLLDNPQTVETYKNGAQAYILRRYDWDRMVDLTLRLYTGKA